MIDHLVSGVNHEASGIPAMAGTTASNRFDLGRMRRLLAALGDPHLAVRAVHVAGSKGKGSTASLLSACLSAAGHRVGLYTSPHLLALEERIAASAPGASNPRPRPIPPDDLAFLVRRHAPAIAQVARAEGPGALSHFEVVTALAFRYFADLSVDVAVLETGLGGTTDATNVLPGGNLEAAVITALGLEHVEALGGSLASIAAAKAGILRPGRPLVLGPQTAHPEAEGMVAAEARRLGCPLVRAQDSVQVASRGLRLEPSRTGQALRERLTITLLPEDPSPSPSSSSLPASPSTSVTSTSSASASAPASSLEAEVGLVGPAQHANVATAVAAARVLRRGGWALPDEALAAGLAAAALPGRFQVVKLKGGGGSSPEPWLLLDGAHTPESAAALAAAAGAALPPAETHPRALVLAAAADKDHRGVAAALRALQPRVVIFTQVPIAGSYARSASAATLAAQWQAAAILAPPGSKALRCRTLVAGSMDAALARAQQELAALMVATSGTAGAVGPGAEGGVGGGAEGWGERCGVLMVTGSLHAVAEVHRLPDFAPLLG
ncbi:hypothetical protein HYH03_002334 [Edaphochlamys debaryana]|uniref:Mur ligase C-terminal domain-containing protein n=1 Tax=Edaphochlamys debaryana TaxID=47281 RepID=A0A835YBT9_9CHLO|nr:hypothetical protein HYH03_002334 [Edaphochlamys debaryana]|eukprot:KAG2500057.1 hypothetical protein HYH03_002334 [Edaphochlamys debaryana]